MQQSLTDETCVIPYWGSERRKVVRARTVCLSVKITRSDDVGFFWARNISDEGMMLAAHVAFHVGEHVSIELSQDLVVDGFLEWRDEDCCGVRFALPINSAGFLASLATVRQEYRRCARRLSVSRLATCYSERGVRAITLTDVSSRGVGLSHGGWLEPGSFVKLVLETGLTRSGRICWSNRGRAGIFLDQAFARDELESASNFGRGGQWTRP